MALSSYLPEIPGLTAAAAPVTIDGTIHPEFSGVAQVLKSVLRGARGGAAVAVYHRGELVVDLWGGVRNSQGDPWRRDTMSPSFSTTKGVASTLMHMAVDRGLADYDDKVVRYWPEFGREGKKNITIRQVLTHQAGLYHIRRMIDDAARMCDWPHMIEAIERARPVHEPGQCTGYHGLTFGFLVGEILQRITGARFADLVRSEIAEPLELDGMYVGAPDHAIDRAAELIWPEFWKNQGHSAWLQPVLQGAGGFVNGATEALRPLARAVGFDVDLESIMDAVVPNGISKFDFGSAETLRSAIPSGNGLFTARSLARMYSALAGGGVLDDVRLMTPATLARATERQPEVGGRAVLPFDMRWRLGYHGVVTSQGVPARAFGHFGFGGSGAWADPNRQLAVAMVVNSGAGTLFGDLRIVRIGGAALSAARAVERSKRTAAVAVQRVYA